MSDSPAQLVDYSTIPSPAMPGEVLAALPGADIGSHAPGCCIQRICRAQRATALS